MSACIGYVKRLALMAEQIAIGYNRSIDTDAHNDTNKQPHIYKSRFVDT